MSNQKQILICPCALDSELNCIETASIIKEAFLSVYEDAKITLRPLSAGGIGTIDAIAERYIGRRYSVPVMCGDDRRRMIDYYLTEKNVAVIEAAAIIGEQYCSMRSPGGITSYGVGSIAADAIQNGAKRLLFALGDTRSIDGGCGVARALGALFLNERGKPFLPTGTTLDEIYYIDRDKLMTVDAICLCDTNDLLLGDVGTVGRYAKEIGRHPDQMQRLMDNLCHLHELIHPETVSEEGDGAGGGIAYMLRALFGARLERSMGKLLKTLDLPDEAVNADLIITAVPHLDARKQTVNFFHALREFTDAKAVAAIGWDDIQEFAASAPWIQATETLLPNGKKPPTDREKKKDLLFHAAIRLAKSLQ